MSDINDKIDALHGPGAAAALDAAIAAGYFEVEDEMEIKPCHPVTCPPEQEVTLTAEPEPWFSPEGYIRSRFPHLEVPEHSDLLAALCDELERERLAKDHWMDRAMRFENEVRRLTREWEDVRAAGEAIQDALDSTHSELTRLRDGLAELLAVWEKEDFPEGVSKRGMRFKLRVLLHGPTP